MIDTDKYESMRLLFLDFIDTASDEVDEEAWKDKLTMLDELLSEVKRLREEVEQMRVLKIVKENERLREENETLRKMDWEYECLWTWLAENTNLLNTIEPLMEEWKKEMIE